MSVYQGLFVDYNGPKIEKENVIEQLKELGCISNPHQEDTLLSPLYKNMLGKFIRVGFYVDIPFDRGSVVNFSSFNYSPIPEVCFWWVLIYRGPKTKIYWCVEQTKLYDGMIKNFFN